MPSETTDYDKITETRPYVMHTGWHADIHKARDGECLVLYCRKLEHELEMLLKRATTDKDLIYLLARALRDLHDWQNGPPLHSPKWLDGWGEAMKDAKAALEAASTHTGEKF